LARLVPDFASLHPGYKVLLALPLVPTDEDRFCDRVLARLSLNVTAGRIGLCLKMIRREGEQPEVIMMRPMTMRWTRAAIARLPKIVDRLDLARCKVQQR
jgi:hypothetical protein